MTPAERAAVQAHLRKLFSNEFIGTIHRDAEDGDVSYAVQIVVLAEDLLDND